MRLVYKSLTAELDQAIELAENAERTIVKVILNLSEWKELCEESGTKFDPQNAGGVYKSVPIEVVPGSR